MNVIFEGSFIGKIIINGLPWEVYEKDELDSECSDVTTLGHTKFEELKIVLKSGLPLPLKRQIMAHEVMHAIMYSEGIYRDTYTDEEVCELIAAHAAKIEGIMRTFDRWMKIEQ